MFLLPDNLTQLNQVGSRLENEALVITLDAVGLNCAANVNQLSIFQEGFINQTCWINLTVLSARLNTMGAGPSVQALCSQTLELLFHAECP